MWSYFMLQSRRHVRHHWPEYTDENWPERSYRMDYVRHLHRQLRSRHNLLSSRSADLSHQTKHNGLHRSTNQPPTGPQSCRSPILLRKRRMGASVRHWNKARRHTEGISFAFESHLHYTSTEAADVPRVEHNVSRGVDGVSDPYGVQAPRWVRREDWVLSDGPVGVRRLPVHDLGEHSKYIGLNLLSVYVFQTQFESQRGNKPITLTHCVFFNVQCLKSFGGFIELHADLIRLKRIRWY